MYMTSMGGNFGFSSLFGSKNKSTPAAMSPSQKKETKKHHVQKKRMAELIVAARNGDVNQVKQLIDKGADVNISGKYGYTPLLFAVALSYNDVALLLLENGCKVNGTDCFGNTPLMAASVVGNVPLSEALILYGANVDAVSYDGNTALIWASANGKFDVVKILIQQGRVKSINRRNDEGYSALKYAVEYEHLQVVSYLQSIGASM